MLPKRGQSGRYPGPHSADQAPPENWLQISHEYCYLSIKILNCEKNPVNKSGGKLNVDGYKVNPILI